MSGKVDEKGIFGFLSKQFPLLDDFQSKLFLVIFSGLFSSFFIYYFNPFNLLAINYDTAIGGVLSIWLAGIIGALILSFTQFFLRSKLNFKSFTVRGFIGWVCFEFILLCIGIFILFGEFDEPFFEEFLLIFKYTISLAILPYFFACLLIAVKKLSTEEKTKKDPLLNNPDRFFLKDEKGKVMLALEPKQLLFLKSENNYISVFYLKNNKIEKSLIRTSLKKLEKELLSPNLIRIHRSYMINSEKIEVVKRLKGKFNIHLEHLPDSPFTVSEKYLENFETMINKE